MTTLKEPSTEKPAYRRSAGEASPLSRPSPLAAPGAGLLENNEYETATSASSGPSSLAPESLSSASSFQSLASSVGSKSSSGICADSAPTSPDHHLLGSVSPALDSTVLIASESSFDNSYVDVNIPDLDDLISACAKIDLGNSKLIEDEAEISLDQTYESAADDTTLVTPQDESSLQTFKTCSGPTEFQTIPPASNVQTTPEGVFKVPLPVNPQKSVVPYVSVESTILKQNSDPEDLFKSALNSFSENSSQRHSPTPCEEIDVIESARDKLNNENANQTFEVDEEERTETPIAEPEVTETSKQLDTFALSTPDATFEEVEAFNSTQTLHTELQPIAEVDTPESLELSENTPKKLNSASLNKTEPILNNSDIKKEEDNLAEDKSWKEQINKSIILEAKSPRENTLNKTNTLNQSKTPNKVDNIIQEDVLPPKSTHTKTVTPTKVDSNVTQEFTSPVRFEDKVDDLNTPAQKEFISPIKKDFQEVISNNKKLNDIINFEVTSSTPLPKKEIIKNDTPKTPKNKSNLFPSETNSGPQSPQPLEQKPSAPVECNNKPNNFDETVAVNRTFEKSSFDGGASELITKDNLEATNVLHENSLNTLPDKEPEEYEAFKPQQQSTSLPPTNVNFQKLQEAALEVAKDIDSSLDEKYEEGEHFISATTDLFEDPAAFDFLGQAGSQQAISRGDRYDSLFMKFDPLAQRLSMLPQRNSISNSPAKVEEEEKEIQQDEPVHTTPKKNPALAAIDRLLFDSPSAEGFNSKVSEETKAKQKDETEKQHAPLVSFYDEKMVKELELVRSSVLQLEEELEKQKLEHKKELEKQKLEYKQQLDKIKESCEDKISNVQTKLSDEIKCKDQMTVVVEEYEKSISRLIADREKDKSSLELEKARLQEELDLANQHLSNTEAAFSDVHSKYERLKKSVAAYRSNEAVLKESIAENQETIKTLENRYEQLKSHAMAQLEKANMELEAIRKQHDAESVKLKALLRKAELKSKSLEETVEQKMKENKELTKIIDEMIARVN